MAAVSLLFLLARAHGPAGRIRAVLDGLLIGTSLLLASWVAILERLVEEGEGGLGAQVIGIAYPLGDVVLVTMAVFLLARISVAGSRGAAPVLLIAGGWIAIAVADSGFLFQTLNGTYSSGNAIDLGWLAGFVAIAAAARHPGAGSIGASAGRDETQRPVGLLVPYLAVALTAILAVFRLVAEGGLDAFTSLSLGAIVVLLSVRQVLTIAENLSLTRDLEARVAERTAELESSRQRFQALVQNSSEVVTVVGRDGVVAYQSSSIGRVFGYAPEEVVNRDFELLVAPGARAEFRRALEDVSEQIGSILRFQTVIRHRNGRKSEAEIVFNSLLDDPSVGGIVLNTRDISEQKMLEEELVHQAFHDSLTSLANRALFRDRVDQALRRRSPARRVAVLFLDLDGFKQINDSVGHGLGDAVLVEVARRLRGCVRVEDTVARIGGDEFAILIEDARERADIRVAESLKKAFEGSFVVEGWEIFVQASIGIATADGSAAGCDELLRNADLAMYRAKARREGGFELFDPVMHDQLVRRVELESDLRRAIRRSELFLQYQPILELAGGEIRGLEALVRWRHPDRGLIPPAQFIDLAEESGLMRGLSRFVLLEACTRAAEWNRLFHPAPIEIGVNISASQFHRTGIVSDVAAALAETGLNPRLLVLEMTESVLLRDEDETLETLRGLKDLGVRLALDDFGTGYSSFSRLLLFPVDMIKIDRSFVDQLRGRADKDQIVETIVGLGHGLGLEIVAEGIEDHIQYLALERMGCELGQGFYFWPALDAARVGELLASEAATVSR